MRDGWTTRGYAAGLVALALVALLATMAARRYVALGVLAIAFVVLTAVLVAVYTSGTVSRRRLERFAVRQRLVVTADNGNQVIRYLATTRRWRVAGFVAGLVASGVFFPRPSGNISVGAELIVIFVGWFAGALIAEVRVEHLEHGPIRAASLQPRRPERYVRRFTWALVPAAAVIAVATGATTAAAAAMGWAEPNWAWAGFWLLVALAVAATVRTIQHAVLRRPQPLAAPDVIAADDAIRSRALCVLSAGGAALVLLMVLNQIGSVHPVGVPDSVIYAVRVYGALAVALFGWLVATSPPPPAPGRADQPALGPA
jgi:CDP-diglyceride synthetase